MENAVLPSPFQNITKIHLVKAVNKLETFNKKHMHSAAVVFSSNTADIGKRRKEYLLQEEKRKDVKNMEEAKRSEENKKEREWK